MKTGARKSWVGTASPAPCPVPRIGRDSAAMREAKPRLTQLMELRDQQRADDFGTSQLLRKRHRMRKKQVRGCAARPTVVAIRLPGPWWCRYRS